MSKQEDTNNEFPPEEVARRRDATIKRMIATPPKKHKDEPARCRDPQSKPGKRGA